MDDDGRDPSMFANPYFWLIVLISLGIWAGVIWAALA
jgi:hypothetical protein